MTIYPAGGFVYFLTDGEFIKIGITGGTAAHRAKQVQYDRGKRVIVLAEMVGTEDDEKALHLRFAHLRTEGEWFRSEPELRDYIASIQPIREIPHGGRANAHVCSFCKKWDEKMVAGPSVFICIDCVELCWDILKPHRAAGRGG